MPNPTLDSLAAEFSNHGDIVKFISVDYVELDGSFSLKELDELVQAMKQAALIDQLISQHPVVLQALP